VKGAADCEVVGMLDSGTDVAPKVDGAVEVEGSGVAMYDEV